MNVWACTSKDQPLHLTRAIAIENLLSFLTNRRDDVLEILTDVTSYSAATAELRASFKALKGAILEIEQRRPKPAERMAVFMPSNIVLYSYVLYLVIPSLYVRQIDFRPSSYVAETTAKLHALLSLAHGLPLRFQRTSQREFVEGTVQLSNIVVFTGAYANAEKIKSQLRKDQLYIFFGHGVNPFIAGERAEIEMAVHDLVGARMFNTGQDCMGPSAVFVHQSIADEFLRTLQNRLKGLAFGSRKDPKADYCPIFYPSTLDMLSQYLMSNSKFISVGGVVDYSVSKIEPTVLYSSLKKKPDIIELFGPVFNVISYGGDNSLKDELSGAFYKDRAMGASVYGNDSLAEFLRPNHMVSVNATLFDIEDGNSPFGGFGPMANYVQYRGRLKVAPILISQMVADLM
jgi:aldehyde dehydrogenase (NAD+)